MSQIDRKSLDDPDETRELPRMTGQIARVGALTVGRATLQPGWRWSTDVRPAAGTPSCRIHHLQLLLSGRMAVRMDDGEHVDAGPGDVLDVPPGHDAWVLGDEPVVVVDFYGNVGQMGLSSEHDRVVTTLLMTDIVASTATVDRLGDATWKQVLANHDRVVRTLLDRHRGREVSTTGDGFLGMFASAIGAVRAAGAIRDGARDLGLEVRAGVHTGEVELLAADIGGLAVHACARIMALAGPSEVLVSATTRALVEGSELRFGERGSQRLRGLERPLEVFVLES